MCVICNSYESIPSENAAGIGTSVNSAGNYSNDYINSLIYNDSYWSGGIGSPVYWTIDDGTYGGSGWNAHQITAIRNVIETYGNYCNPSQLIFSEVSPGNANVDIVFATTDTATTLS